MFISFQAVMKVGFQASALSLRVRRSGMPIGTRIVIPSQEWEASSLESLILSSIAHTMP